MTKSSIISIQHNMALTFNICPFLCYYSRLNYCVSYYNYRAAKSRDEK